MFDQNSLFPAGHGPRANAFSGLTAALGGASYAQPGGYRGPERRSAASQSAAFMSLMLDEIDYGMVLVSEDNQVLHLNHTARADLDRDHPLQLLGRELRARLPQDVAPLHDALQDAQHGKRSMLKLGDSAGEVSVVLVPLGAAHRGTPQATLLLLGKRRVCERLSVEWFARHHSLTPAETRVLEGLCQGLDPREVAERHNVGLATVRTQIGSIRAKTGTESIRDLVRHVATLPPMVSALRAA